MNNTLSNFLFIIACCLLIANCANRGTPSGGEKDIEPPVLVRSEPKNFTTNFNAQEIKIYFNEYIKIKDLNKQLIISPPMNTQPEITPLGSASKYIRIRIYDTLAPNTTYAFNFGNSIVDNNEGNPFPYFKYVFSTGDYIDSLKVTGAIVDAVNKKPENFVSVALYEVDSTFSDSIIYKQKPKYVTNTLDSLTTFSIENIKAGKYLLVALKEGNQDFKFQQKSDKIGYHNTLIEVPTDSTYLIKLFKEDLDFKAFKPRLISQGKIAFGYQGDYKDMAINLLTETPSDYEHIITKDEKSDSLLYWYKPKLEIDSLSFKVSYKQKVQDTFHLKITDKYQDSLALKAVPSGQINFNEDFYLSSPTPFQTINTSLISIIDKDSVAVPYTTKLDTLNNKYFIDFEKGESNRYNIQLLPEAVTDFFGYKNDTLQVNLQTRGYDDYGNARIVLQNASYPVIVQLTNEKGDVKAEKYSTQPEPLDFTYLSNGNYLLRVIFDANGNKKYDTGSYLKKQQPERISYYPKPVEVRVGWDVVEEFILKE
ncbi:Ig-like domain-containing protein [Formosa sp. S-31]|uniref:Ig-like domain-containing protein n=1 Tax=Formosa sp. S-31 TaxID=2790949 RepID=UPI003EB6D449